MKRNYILLVIVMVIFSSCDDVLEVDNRSFGTAEEFYVTADGYESLINANYSRLREIYGNSPYMFCAGTDLYAEGSGRAAEPEGLSQYTQLNPSSSDVDHIYNTAYRAILTANTALYYADITEQTSSVSNRIGEVKYLRANAYFLLVQSYGGVPIVTDLIDSPVTEFDRNSAEEVYNLILEDLNDALDRVETGNFNGRVNRRAVLHLLAKVHLTRGYESFGTGADFTSAASFADQAIGGQGLSLSFEEVWSFGNEMNEEVLFSVQYSSGSVSADPTELGSQQSLYFGPYMGGNEVAGDAPRRSYTLLATDFALRLFTPEDERYEGTFMTQVFERYFDYHEVDDTSGLGVSEFYEPYWFTPADSTDYVDNAILNADFEYHPYETTYAQIVSGDWETIPAKKFDDPTAPFGESSEEGSSTKDIILSRLGDTYLLAAEAYLQAGDPATGLQRLNVVRARAGVADATLAEFDIDYILDERGRELFGEYHRWFDLKRTGKLVERASLHHPLVQEANFAGSGGNLKILRPIPQSALDLNANKDFPQNPAYD
ncbi:MULTISPECIES: RagB/SusD family nutrient uptake outer membrane protein [Flavobacteriaceae]|uniref:RagB/SusD family nutrient uptake outer membrane protein n=1 Tax=Flavobacteriaceae TaxID=49546 RepID=UPI00149095DB|nr:MULTISPECIES: RagB/SusD family nutrient uptake outer membrane protein [Allomuricauda]MDC6365911.1 RagB/SusD family nutrient uptake outer membrane protein [Muricauda sp. AC10]